MISLDCCEEMIGHLPNSLWERDNLRILDPCTGFGNFMIILYQILKKKNVIIYFIFISIFLELAHLVIPNRSFQFSDLFGNIIGLLISIFILKIYNYLEKK